MAAAQWHHSGGSQGPAHVCTRHSSIQFFVASEYHQNMIYHYPGPVAISGHFRLQVADFWKVCNSLIVYHATVHMLATNLRVLQVSLIGQNKRNLLGP